MALHGSAISVLESLSNYLGSSGILDVQIYKRMHDKVHSHRNSHNWWGIERFEIGDGRCWDDLSVKCVLGIWDDVKLTCFIQRPILNTDITEQHVIVYVIKEEDCLMDFGTSANVLSYKF